MEFEQLLQCFQLFKKFVGGESALVVDEFLFNNQLQDLLFTLEHFPATDFKAVQQRLDKASQLRKHPRIDFVRALAAASDHSRDIDTAKHNIHRHFDYSFSSILSEKAGEAKQSRINHSVLGLVHMNMRLGCYDEALRGISEGLRISQNNADEESLNFCIVYLATIAKSVGRNKAQRLLAQHAIGHSFNEGNPMHMLLNCVHFASLWRLHRIPTGLRIANISWTDILHLALKRQLLADHSLAVKNQTLLFKNTVMPRLLQQLAQANMEPGLDHLIRVYYSVKHKQAFRTAIAGQMLQSREQTLAQPSQFARWLRLYHARVRRRDSYGCLMVEHTLKDMLLEPSEKLQLWLAEQLRLIYDGKLIQARQMIWGINEFSQRMGFDNQLRLQALLCQVLLCFEAGQFIACLNKAESLYEEAKDANSSSFKCQAMAYKAILHVMMDSFDLPVRLYQQMSNEMGMSQVSSEARGLCSYAEALYSASKGHLQQAVSLLQMALSHFKQALNYKWIAQVLFVLARLESDLGRADKAQSWAAWFNAVSDAALKTQSSKVNSVVALDLLSCETIDAAIAKKAIVSLAW